MNQQRLEPPDAMPDWQSCETELLSGFVRRINRRRMLRIAMTTTGAAGCLLVLGIASWLKYLQRLDTNYQKSFMTCTDIHELAAPYLSGHLDALRQKSFEHHIQKCKNCRKFVTELQSAPTA